jgi:hypothetical protein
MVLALAGLAAVAVGVYRWMAAEPAAVACRTGLSAYARLELLFGLGRQGGGEVSEEEWRAFLEREVTPRFPDGLTVVTAYGQWRGRSGQLVKEPSRMLVIWYRPQAASNGEIEAIRQAYRARFGQESVMRVDSVSCVSF